MDVKISYVYLLYFTYLFVCGNHLGIGTDRNPSCAAGLQPHPLLAHHRVSEVCTYCVPSVRTIMYCEYFHSTNHTMRINALLRFTNGCSGYDNDAIFFAGRSPHGCIQTCFKSVFYQVKVCCHHIGHKYPLKGISYTNTVVRSRE